MRACLTRGAQVLRSLGVGAPADQALDTPCPAPLQDSRSCGSNSVVECDLAKVDVESSNLFSRSIDGRLNTGRSAFSAPTVREARRREPGLPTTRRVSEAPPDDAPPLRSPSSLARGRP